MEIVRSFISIALAPYPTPLAFSRYRLVVRILIFLVALPAVLQVVNIAVAFSSGQTSVNPGSMLLMAFSILGEILLAVLLLIGLHKRTIWGYCFALLLALQNVVSSIQGIGYVWLRGSTPFELGLPRENVVSMIALPIVLAAVALFLFLALFKSRVLFLQAFEMSPVLETTQDQPIPLVPQIAARSRQKRSGRKA